MLAQIVNGKFLVAVSGTHGKTTTTAMVGKLLTDAGFDPLVFVGVTYPSSTGLPQDTAAAIMPWWKPMNTTGHSSI